MSRSRQRKSWLGGLRSTFNRIGAVFSKELVQMRRDRLTFATMLAIPIMQLLLFGFAINNDPKELPTALLMEDRTPITRALAQALETSGYYDFDQEIKDPRKIGELLARGDAAFVVAIPAGFTDRLIRGERPQILIEADASDPAASSNAVAQIRQILMRALNRELTGPLAKLAPSADPVDIVVHRRYNPEGVTQYNIVPGLLGVILTMTLVMITAMAVTREVEQGTIENLLAMPTRPFEVMVGKITPYIFVGAVQTLIILLAARYVFETPFAGPLGALFVGVVVFIVANLAVGYTFSTVAQSQMQAMQLSFFFFLPSLLLSGFMFPFRGMPDWAQAIGECLPLTHFLRVVRGVMLKGAGLGDLTRELIAMALFTTAAGAIAMLRYRRTLD